MVSLGCAKNLVDAEIMLGSILGKGMQIISDAAGADVVIVNTCSFIDAAKEESIETILRAHRQRELKTRPGQKLIVSGCMSQRFSEELKKEMPEVDAFVGLDQVTEMGEIISDLVARPDDAAPLSFVVGRSSYVPDFDTPRYRLTPSHTAYVKIAEGCNHPCSFCVIPQTRGQHRSRTVDSVTAEVRNLVSQGVRELNLISQDTTFFGMDHWEKKPGVRQPVDSSRGPTLSILLREIQQIEGDFWVRLLYTHPAHWSRELMEVIAECDKVARYIDIPLQHIHPVMLGAMRRETSDTSIRRVIDDLRETIPGVALRTTFIVGFPGERENHFNCLMDFIRETRFDRLGVFAYSQEEGTRAAGMPGQVPARTKVARYRKAMELQQTVACEIAESMVGRTVRVLTDEPLIGRTQADAPEIDCRVILDHAGPVGEFLNVRITGTQGYDLIGVAVD